MTDQRLKNKILIDNPAASNIDKPPKMDDFFKEILEEKKKRLELGMDEIIEKTKQKTLNIMGPLCRVWQTLKGVTAFEENQ